MSEADFQPLTPATLRWRGDTPESTVFDDPYFARGRGAQESRTVFVDGNDLPGRFASLAPQADFVAGETGFGTGLNFLCTAEAFLKRAPDNACLHYLAVERHPLTPPELARALAPAPDPGGLAEALLDHFPPATPGFHRLILAGGRIRLTLMLGEATTMLRQLRARVDAWLLDGFAPARNPGMWSPALFAELARLSRPGTTLATYTAAGAVRRGLQDAGFRVTRVAGFGGKRHRLNGHLEQADTVPAPAARQPVLVVGAGLAGACTARALAERGHSVNIIDRAGVAAGASGNLAGVLYTTPSAHPTAQNRFYQSSYLHALHWLHRLGFPRSPTDGALAGVLQQPADERGARKLAKAAASGLWPRPIADFGSVDGEPRLRLPGGGYIAPGAWCQFLLDHPNIEFRRTSLQQLEPRTATWRAHTDTGPLDAQAVVLAQAAATAELEPLSWLPLQRIRGQVTHVEATESSRGWHVPRCHRGYLTPAVQGLHCLGATFDPRDDSSEPRDADDARNLDTLRRYRPADWQALGGDHMRVAGRRVGFRCQSPDFLPLAGPAVDAGGGALPGLYLNLAHGARGLTGTPLCAEIVAALLDDEPVPVDAELLEALLPKRFTVQAR